MARQREAAKRQGDAAAPAGLPLRPMPHVAVEPGVRLYVDDSGGIGRPVVFLHGWPLDSRHWEYQVAALQPRGLRCVAIDSRGFGRSDRAWGHYGFDLFADDLKRVLDDLELEGAALVGFSLGAGTALRYMSRHAGSGVTQVVLCGVPGDWDRAVIDGMIELDRPALVRAMGTLLLGEADEVTRHWVHAMGFAAMPYATRRGLELLRDADLREDVEALAAPTLIMHGGDDRLVPQPLVQALHRAIDESRLVLLEQHGHGPFLTARARFNAALEDFLEPPLRRALATA